MAQHRSQGRHHECYAVRLPGFFARVVTAILVPVVDGIDYAENKGSWYHIYVEDQMQRPGRVSDSELVHGTQLPDLRLSSF